MDDWRAHAGAESDEQESHAGPGCPPFAVPAVPALEEEEEDDPRGEPRTGEGGLPDDIDPELVLDDGEERGEGGDDDVGRDEHHAEEGQQGDIDVGAGRVMFGEVLGRVGREPVEHDAHGELERSEDGDDEERVVFEQGCHHPERSDECDGPGDVESADRGSE